VVDRGRVARSTMDRWWRGPKAPEHDGDSPEHGLRPHRSMEAHRLGHNRERGTWGTRLRPDQSSGGGEVARRRREMTVVVGARWGGSCRLGSEQRRAGVSVVMAGGAPHPFIVAGEGHAGRGRGKRPTVMALTPL
jgi:hypothetical protein